MAHVVYPHIDVRTLLNDIRDTAYRVVQGYGSLADVLKIAFNAGMIYGYGYAYNSPQWQQIGNNIFSELYRSAQGLPVPRQLIDALEIELTWLG